MFCTVKNWLLSLPPNSPAVGHVPQRMSNSGLTTDHCGLRYLPRQAGKTVPKIGAVLFVIGEKWSFLVIFVEKWGKSVKASHKTSKASHKTVKASRKTERASHKTSKASHKTVKASHKTTQASCKTERTSHKTAKTSLKTERVSRKTVKASLISASASLKTVEA